MAVNEMHIKHVWLWACGVGRDIALLRSGLAFPIIKGAALGGLIGIVAGAPLSFVVTEWKLRAKVHKLSEQYISRSDDVISEAIAALGRIGTSGRSVCSDQDIRLLREVVINSKFLKSAGYLDGSNIICSSLIGHYDDGSVRQPDFITPKGYGVYIDEELAGIPEVFGFIIRKGQASVVVNKSAYTSTIDPRLDVVVLLSANDGAWFPIYSTTEGHSVLRPPLLTGRPAWIDGARYEVVCSREYKQCIAARFRSAGFDVGLVLVLVLLSGALGAAVGGVAGFIFERRRSLGNRLRAALRADEVSLVYQPIVRFSDRKIVGYEALSRWRAPDGEYVPPDVFIAAAEKEGFITDVTRYVICRALAEMGPFLRANSDVSISINVSADDLRHPCFYDFVSMTCTACEISPTALCFEITERAGIDSNVLKEGVYRLHQQGHRIYIDDFGVDYSNLSYLIDMHVDAIKLDRMFARDIELNAAAEVIVSQMASIAEELNIAMIVEGIETENQARYFTSISHEICGQGWLFGKPMPVGSLRRA